MQWAVQDIVMLVVSFEFDRDVISVSVYSELYLMIFS